MKKRILGIILSILVASSFTLSVYAKEADTDKSDKKATEESAEEADTDAETESEAEEVDPADVEDMTLEELQEFMSQSLDEEVPAEEEDDIISKIELEPKVEEPEPASTVDVTRWIPEVDRTLTMQLDIPSNTTRFEIFYTATMEEPTVTFKSTTDNLTVYKAGEDVYREDGFIFTTRSGLKVEGYDNLRYMAIYISNTPDPGKWTMSVYVPDAITELFMVSTDIYAGWQTLVQDYKMPPLGVIFWYVDEKKSVYRDTPIDMINSVIVDEPIPEVNHVGAITPEEPDQTPKLMMMCVILAVMLLAFIGFIAYHTQKAKQEREKERRQAIVNRENDKLQKKKAQINAELDRVLDDFGDDYIDDDEFGSYLDDESISNSANKVITAESLGIDIEPDEPSVHEKVEEAKTKEEPVDNTKPLFMRQNSTPSWATEGGNSSGSGFF